MSVGIPTPTVPQNEPTPGSLTGLMDALTAVQATVPEHPLLAGLPALTLTRWRPNQANPPCLYNWLLPSTNERRDLHRVRDIVGISTRIAISWADVEDRMDYVEAAADAYRAVVDAAFWDGMRTPRSGMGAATTWSMRASMQSFSEEIGVPLVGIEWIQQFWLDHAA